MKPEPIKVPGYPEAAELLHAFYREAHTRPEITRIASAKKLLSAWTARKIPVPCPALPGLRDYWYLIQLYALERHRTDRNTPYVYDFGKEEVLYTGSPTRFTLFLTLMEAVPAAERIPVLPTAPATISTSRLILDRAIGRYGGDVVASYGLSRQKWKLTYVPYDILLRANPSDMPSVRSGIFLDGYRYHPGLDITTALFGGGTRFGGKQYIDSVAADLPLRIQPVLCIIRKTYGYTV